MVVVPFTLEMSVTVVQVVVGGLVIPEGTMVTPVKFADDVLMSVPYSTSVPFPVTPNSAIVVRIGDEEEFSSKTMLFRTILVFPRLVRTNNRELTLLVGTV